MPKKLAYSYLNHKCVTYAPIEGFFVIFMIIVCEIHAVGTM